VVADTSVLTTLIKAGYSWLIESAFRRVLVPPAVAEELAVFHAGLPDWIIQWDQSPAYESMESFPRLGRGEVECIQLALAVNADLVLCDDQQACRECRKRGKRTLGSVGLLLWACHHGLINSMSEALDHLARAGGLYLSESVRAEAIRLAGKLPSGQAM